MDYSRLRECLPQTDRERFDALWEQTGGNTAPLHACLAGAFSTGKTTLLNTLIGSALLPVAQEETTALPTFVEYAPALRCELTGTDGVTPITPEALPAIITNPPQEARLISVGLPLPWLQGLCLVDLPGYGFARTGGKHRQAWSDFISEYVTESPHLVLLCLLVDLRHPGLPMDVQAYQWLTENGIPLQIVGTKADKLKANEKRKNLDKLNKLFPSPYKAVAYSSLKGDGKNELLEHMLANLEEG